MAAEKTKVYTYTRVSTAMQIDGYSLDAQKARMKAYADVEVCIGFHTSLLCIQRIAIDLHRS